MNENKISFEEIGSRIRAMPFPEIDVVIGIATGGIVPASLVAFLLEKPLSLVHISHRDPSNEPIYEQPIVQMQPSMRAEWDRILLVDDVSVSGKTMQRAYSLFSDKKVTTFVLKGKADLCVFPEVEERVQWPWKV